MTAAPETLETLDGVAKKKSAAQSAEEQAALELVRLAREQGLSLTGPDGLLKQLTKAVLQTSLNEELTEHLGYDKHDAEGAAETGSGNIRNGTRPKTVLTEHSGPVQIEVPRDRAGTFEPQIVKKRQRRLSGVDEVVLSLYAKGLTTGEISAHFAEIYGASVSKETVSRITDKVIAEMNDWVARPLEATYTAIFIDAIVCDQNFADDLAFVRDREASSTGASRPSVDLPGAVLVVAGLAGVVLGLGNSAVHGWEDPSTGVPLAVGALLVVGFLLREARTAHPLLPLSVIWDRNRGAAFLSIAISGVGSFAIFLYLSYYIQQILGWSATGAGLGFLPFAAVLVLGAGISGSVLLPRMGPRPVIPTGCLFAAGALVLLTRIDLDSSYASGVLPSVLLFGFGTGLIFGSAQNVATSGVDRDNSGVASAMVNTMQQVGGAIGLAAFTYIGASAVNRYLTDHADQPAQQLQSLAALSSYHTVFWVAAAIFLAGAALTAAVFRSGPVALISRRCRPTKIL